MNEYWDQNTRPDGRLFAQCRPTVLATSLLKHSVGSALVKQGNTKILVANTIQIGQPSPEFPDHGDVLVSVSSNTNGSSNRNANDNNNQSLQLLQAWLQRMLDEWLPPKLNLLTGRACFRLIVTVLVLKDDGNLRDASLFACAAAWNSTKLPQMHQDFQDVDGKLWLKDSPQQQQLQSKSSESSSLSLPSSDNNDKVKIVTTTTTTTNSEKSSCRISLTMGVVKIGDNDKKIKLLLDPTSVEEKQLSGLLTCVICLPSYTIQMDYSGGSSSSSAASLLLSASDLALAYKLTKARADELSRLLL